MLENIYENFFLIEDPSDLLDQITKNDQSDLLVVLPKDTQHMALIEKILAAIKVDHLSACNVLALDTDTPMALLPAISSLGIQKIISFGYRASHLGINIDADYYQMTALQGIDMIFTTDLDQLAANGQEKRLLWEALKKWIPLS